MVPVAEAYLLIGAAKAVVQIDSAAGFVELKVAVVVEEAMQIL